MDKGKELLVFFIYKFVFRVAVFEVAANGFGQGFDMVCRLERTEGKLIGTFLLLGSREAPIGCPKIILRR
jgi:hypothetical protein